MPEMKDHEEEYARLLRTEIERLQSRWMVTDQHLGELLAVIHGDGGQYKHRHGDSKGTEDAITIVCALRRDLDQCRYELAEGKRMVHEWLHYQWHDARGDALIDQITGWSAKP